MTKINLAFYQPDIPQNIGAAMRLCACLDIAMHIIEPCGFAWRDNEFRRSGMDYIDHVKLTKFSSWGKYRQEQKGRIFLLTTKASVPYTDISYKDGDTLLMGRESVGAPQEIHDSVDGRIIIPMYGEMRSLNIVNSASIVTGEALRQVNL